jgi:hypothetical protein
VHVFQVLLAHRPIDGTKGDVLILAHLIVLGQNEPADRHGDGLGFAGQAIS